MAKSRTALTVAKANGTALAGQGRAFSELTAAITNDPAITNLETGQIAQDTLRALGLSEIHGLPPLEENETATAYIRRIWNALDIEQQAQVQVSGIDRMQTLSAVCRVATWRELWYALQTGSWSKGPEHGVNDYVTYCRMRLQRDGFSSSYSWKWATTLTMLKSLYTNQDLYGLKEILPSDPVIVFQNGMFLRYVRVAPAINDILLQLAQQTLRLPWHMLEEQRERQMLDVKDQSIKAQLWRLMADLHRLLGSAHDTSIGQMELDQIAKFHDIKDTKPVKLEKQPNGDVVATMSPAQAKAVARALPPGQVETGTTGLDPMPAIGTAPVELPREWWEFDDSKPLTEVRLISMPTCPNCDSKLPMLVGFGTYYCTSCHDYVDTDFPTIEFVPYWFAREETSNGWSVWTPFYMTDDLMPTGQAKKDTIFGLDVITWTMMVPAGTYKDSNAPEPKPDSKGSPVQPGDVVIILRVSGCAKAAGRRAVVTRTTRFRFFYRWEDEKKETGHSVSFSSEGADSVWVRPEHDRLVNVLTKDWENDPEVVAEVEAEAATQEDDPDLEEGNVCVYDDDRDIVVEIVSIVGEKAKAKIVEPGKSRLKKGQVSSFPLEMLKRATVHPKRARS